MAVYRAIYTSFWTDPTVEEDFLPEDKYFMLYVLTNPSTNMCGCYQISLKRISEDMGYSREKVEKILDRFRDTYHGTVQYDKETRELFVKNWHKYNWTDSPKFDLAIRQGIVGVKSARFRKALIELFNHRLTVLEGKSLPIESDDFEDEDSEKEKPRQIGMDIPEMGEELSSAQPGMMETGFNPPVEIIPEIQGEGIGKKGSCPYEKIKDMFNGICVHYPKLLKMGKSRKMYISARWSEYGENIDVFRTVFENMENSDFLRGFNGGWRASFDWAMLPNNFIKVFEGNYKNVNHGNQGQSGGWSVIQDEASGGQL